MQNLLRDLNTQQKEAVLTTEGPLLIVAGAGAGKTKTLTHRIAHLIDSGTPPEAILAITFTNKAAREMRERAFALIGRGGGEGASWGIRPGLPWIGTFHGLGAYILREKGTLLGLAKNPVIADADDAHKLLKEAMKRAVVDPKQFEPRRIAHYISRHKGRLGAPGEVAKGVVNSWLASAIERTYSEYERLLRESGVLDFDDLLEKTVHLLEGHPDVLRYYQDTWRYVHVDEYQDTNEVQYRLVSLLAAKERNLCVVGDSDQNIYSWRGATIANILDFENDYPGAKVVLLEQNYRSTKTILAAANRIIEKNTLRKPKNLFTANPEGERIALAPAYDEGEEARRVAEKAAAHIRDGARPRDIAVLYRTNFQSRALEEAFLYAGIPYQVLGTRFYDRKEVKDTVSYLRAALNPASSLDLERVINVPPRGIGKVTLEKVLAGKRDALPQAMRAKVEAFDALLGRIRSAAHSMRPSALLRFIVSETGIEKMYREGDDEDAERLANVRELATVAARYDALEGGAGIEQFLADIALESDQDRMKEHSDAVRLMTVHAAKGLEFPFVFVTGMEQDLFPSKRAGDESKDESEREEERRLFYVALTRAAKRVHLSYASFRTIFGQRQVNAPSEFLADIPRELLDEERPGFSIPLDSDEDALFSPKNFRSGGFSGGRTPWGKGGGGWGARRPGGAFSASGRHFGDVPMDDVFADEAPPSHEPTPPPGASGAKPRRKVSLLGDTDEDGNPIVRF